LTLRVLVDVTPIPGERTGVGVYATELLGAVDAPDIDLHVLANARDANELSRLVPKGTVHPVRVRTRPLRIAWSHTVLPLRVRRLRADVFHGTHYTLPAGLRGSAVVTFHDPTFFTHPELHERAKVAYFTRAARTGATRATRVIAVSEYAKRGAVEHAGADPSRVDVVYEGVDVERYKPAGERAATDTPYILFVGTLEPRKDVPALVRAYEEVAKRGHPHELVLVGRAGWGIDAIEAAVRGMGAGSVRMTGYVSEPTKIELIRGASAFVYPSIAEGFGLPVLEAMACGTPTIATTGSAPEEMAGDAALLVPPRDPIALRDAILRILEDRSLADDLRARGPDRAQAFTWRRAAAQTADVWRRAAGDRS
jgi:glycosyltransferase involved in cell wall biosynthesis